MNAINRLLHIGVVAFAQPALLMIGDTATLLWLATLISSRSVVHFDKCAEVRLMNVVLRVVPTAGVGRLSRTSDTFTLEVSPSEAIQFAEQLNALAEAAGPKHIYLDPATNTANVDVLVSKGEYDPENIFSN